MENYNAAWNSSFREDSAMASANDITQKPSLTAPSVSVIIVNYETSSYVRRCVRSLRDQGQDLEIIVVDNASPSGDWQNLTDLDVTFVRNENNEGYGLGCNKGAVYAHAPNLCILNPDTVVPPGMMQKWLESLSSLLASGHNVGLVAPCLRNENGNIQRSTYSFPGPISYWLYHSLFAGLAKKFRKLVPLPHVWSGQTKRREVDWVMGSALLIPRTAWNAVDGFSPHFFLYAEDTDLCYRLWEQGYAVLQDPSVEVIHTQGSPSANRRGEAIRHYFSGLETFVTLHYPCWKRITTRLSILTDLSIRLSLVGASRVLWPSNQSLRERSHAYATVLRMLVRRLLK